MAARKTSKKTNKKHYKKSSGRTVESRTISFLVGIITVALIALAIFSVSQGKNYKSILGEKTQILNSR